MSSPPPQAPPSPPPPSDPTPPPPPPPPPSEKVSLPSFSSPTTTSPPPLPPPSASSATTTASSTLETYLNSPFPSYTLSDWVKAECPGGCKASKRFYCTHCLCFIAVPPGVKMPQLRLPVQVDIVMADNRKKSTAIQVAVCASSESVRVLDTWEHELNEAAGLVKDWDAETTMLLFPSPHAVTLDSLQPEELNKIKKFVLLDSRWNNTTKILEHPSIHDKLKRHVKLKDPPGESKCWRYHREGEGHLCSAEALYYLLKEYEALTGKHATQVGDAKEEGTKEEAEEKEEEEAPLEELLHLFRLNLRVIEEAYVKQKKYIPLPMAEEGKSRLRDFRSQQAFKKQKADV